MTESARAWRKANPLKRAAHQMVAAAVAEGILIRQPCQDCGATPAQAHHADHSRALEVEWLCAPCHRLRQNAPIDRERLRAIRTRRLLTQKELAAKVGLRWQTISEIESGRQQPRFSTIRALAVALDIEPAELTGAT